MKTIKKIFIVILAIILAIVFAITISAFNKRPKNPFKGKTTTIIAHRGGGAINPENTIGALVYTENFFKDKKDVSWMQEFDIRLTKDKKMIVFHNYYIGTGNPKSPGGINEDTHTSCGNQFKGKIEEFTYEQIKNCDLIPQFEFENPGKKIAYPEGDYQIPLLEDVFKTLKHSILILDFKMYESWGYKTEDIEFAYKKTAELIDKYNMWDKIIFENLNDTVNLRKAIKHFKDKYNQSPVILGSLDRRKINKSRFVIKGDDVYSWLGKAKILLSNVLTKPIFDIGSFPVEFQGTDYRKVISIINWKTGQQNILNYWWNGYNAKDKKLLLDKKVDGIFADDWKMLYDLMKERKLIV